MMCMYHREMKERSARERETEINMERESEGEGGRKREWERAGEMGHTRFFFLDDEWDIEKMS